MSVKEKESLEEKSEKCEHDWKTIGENGTHLQLQCKKCGKNKEIYLFP
jgi:hypothetical protein